MDLIKLIPITCPKSYLYSAMQFGGLSDKISPLANGVLKLYAKVFPNKPQPVNVDRKMLKELAENMICIYFDYDYGDMPLGGWDTNCFDGRFCEEDCAEKVIDLINFLSYQGDAPARFPEPTPQWVYSSNHDEIDHFRFLWGGEKADEYIQSLKKWGELFDNLLVDKNDYLLLDYLLNSIHKDNEYNEYHLMKSYSLCQLFLEKEHESELDKKLPSFIAESDNNRKKSSALFFRRLRNKIAHGDFVAFEKIVEEYAESIMDGCYAFDYSEYSRKNWVLLHVCCQLDDIVAFANAFASTIKNRMKSHPINPVSSNDGVTGLCKFSTPNMEMATFNLLRRTYKGGTCGVLTRTNDEALRMVGLLKKNGYRARLIQSNDGFNLYNLYEMRTFVGMLGVEDKMPVIPQDVWDATVSRFQRRFQKSECLTECLTLLHTFDKTTPNKYMSDLVEFISESKFEDFISTGGDEILVSTVHKSKGREFDYVYLMLNRYLIQNDADRRVFYVGFTRAKRNLFVCYNNSAFDRFAVPGCQHYADPKPYPECDELIEQLSHKGVFLGYFQDKQQRIVQMYSGAPLTMDGDYLRYDFGSYKAPVLRFSNRTRTDFAKHYSDGYSPLSAKVRFLVYWKPADDPDAEETLIILPEVKFKRNQQ